MGKFRDLTGLKFGRLTVISVSCVKRGRYHWNCICECGGTLSVEGTRITSGNTSSCGCIFREIMVKRNTTHGKSRTRENLSWKNAKQRCYNKNHPYYKNYGGRGIIMCDRWINSFTNFISDMGVAPSNKHTLERMDVNGNYEPSNCKWATYKEQARNTRRSKIIEYKGEVKSLPQWCEDLSLNYNRVRDRLLTGWTVDRAFTT